LSWFHNLPQAQHAKIPNGLSAVHAWNLKSRLSIFLQASSLVAGDPMSAGFDVSEKGASMNKAASRFSIMLFRYPVLVALAVAVLPIAGIFWGLGAAGAAGSSDSFGNLSANFSAELAKSRPDFSSIKDVLSQMNQADPTNAGRAYKSLIERAGAVAQEVAASIDKSLASGNVDAARKEIDYCSAQRVMLGISFEQIVAWEDRISQVKQERRTGEKSSEIQTNVDKAGALLAENRIDEAREALAIAQDGLTTLKKKISKEQWELCGKSIQAQMKILTHKEDSLVRIGFNILDTQGKDAAIEFRRKLTGTYRVSQTALDKLDYSIGSYDEKMQARADSIKEAEQQRIMDEEMEKQRLEKETLKAEARQKAEEKSRLAREEQQRAKEQKAALEKARRDSIALAKAEQERLGKEEKARLDGISAAKAEEERLAREANRKKELEEKRQERLSQAEREREQLQLLEQQARADSIKNAEAEKDRQVREQDRIAQAEKDRLARAEQDRLAQAEKDRLARAEQDRLAQAEKDRLAQAEQERKNQKQDQARREITTSALPALASAPIPEEKKSAPTPGPAAVPVPVAQPGPSAAAVEMTILAKDAQVAQQYILEIYSLLERNKVEEAYSGFMNGRDMIKNNVDPDVFLFVERAVMQAHNEKQKLAASQGVSAPQGSDTRRAETIEEQHIQLINSLISAHNAKEAYATFQRYKKEIKSYMKREDFKALEEKVHMAYKYAGGK
jgi:actin-related protein